MVNDGREEVYEILDNEFEGAGGIEEEEEEDEEREGFMSDGATFVLDSAVSGVSVGTVRVLSNLCLPPISSSLLSFSSLPLSIVSLPPVATYTEVTSGVNPMRRAAETHSCRISLAPALPTPSQPPTMEGMGTLCPERRREEEEKEEEEEEDVEEREEEEEGWSWMERVEGASGEVGAYRLRRAAL